MPISRFPTHSLRMPSAPSLGRTVAVVIAISTLARLLFASGLDYGVDEAYAVAVSGTFQWSFFDHPPVTFWTAGLIQLITHGHAPHWLMRLPFVLAFSGTLALIYLIGKRLFSEAAGLWAVVFLAVAPFFFASAGSWIVPDGPVDFFLAASTLVLIRILYDGLSPEETRREWLTLGVLFGLATLSKYHAFLFAFGAVIFLLATPHRRLLARPAPWIAGLIALAIFSPVMFWNATHGWISIAFQSGRSHAGGGIFPVHVLQMLAGEAAYLMPWTLVFGLYVLLRVVVTRPSWLSDDGALEKALFLVALGAPAILLFTLLPLFGSRGLPHWPMPGWLLIFPVIGAWMAEVSGRGRRWPMSVAGTSAALLGVLAVSVVILLNSTFVDGWLSRETSAFGPRGALTPLVVEGADWRGLSAALKARDLGLDGNRFVVALKWHEAARIGASLGRDAPVTVFDPDARGFAFLIDQKTLMGRDAIVITRADESSRIVPTLTPFFERIDEPRAITLKVAGGVPFPLAVTIAHSLKQTYPLAYGITSR